MQCSNHQSYTQDQMIVLDLEKKYFEILYKIFSSIQFQDELKSLINDINRRWERIYTHWGKENVVDLDMRMTGEDFSYYTHQMPGCFYRLGVGNVAQGLTSGLHTPTFNVDEKCLEVGTGLMTYLAYKQLSA